MKMQVSRITPPVTWAPWNPVIVKKHDANRLTLGPEVAGRADAGRVVVAEHQLVIFVDLDARGSVEPIRTVASRKTVHLAPVAVLDGREGQDHRDRRADQDEGVDRGQVDAQRVGQLVVGQGPVVGLRAARPRPRRRRRSARRAAPRPWPRGGRGRRRAGRESSACSASSLGEPGVGRGGPRRPRSVRPGRREHARPCVSSSRGQVGAGRVEVAVGGRRAAGPEDDVRPDQPGEEHDLGGQEQPHRDLAGRHRGLVVDRPDGGGVARSGTVGAAGACAMSGSTFASLRVVTRRDERKRVL